MNKPHKHAELIKAWADGAEIQSRVFKSTEWTDENNPSWYESWVYRIKPKELEPWQTALLEAARRGEEVQVLLPDSRWVLSSLNVLLDDYTWGREAEDCYRIKPIESKPVVRWLWSSYCYDSKGYIIDSYFMSEDEANDTYENPIKLEWSRTEFPE